jgi:hypothetical protein
MDINEIKDLKKKCEQEIFSVLRMFENSTKCSVYDVNILVETPMGKENGNVVDVSLKVQV